MPICPIIIYILFVILLIVGFVLLYVGISDISEIPKNVGYLTTIGSVNSCKIMESIGWWIFKKYNTVVDYNLTLNKKTHNGSANIKTRDKFMCDLYNNPYYKLQVYYDPNNVELSTFVSNSNTSEIIKITFGCFFIVFAFILLIYRNKTCEFFNNS